MNHNGFLSQVEYRKFDEKLKIRYINGTFGTSLGYPNIWHIC